VWPAFGPALCWGDPMARYTARIYDKSRSLLAVLENTVGAHYTRRIGQACEVGFGIPASDPKAALLSEAMYFDLYRDGTRIASAQIEKRDMDRTPYVVTGLTNEIKLRDLMTPANWTYDGWEAMDAIRDLLLEFRTFVKQTKADWEDVNGERYRVDTTTQPTRAGDVVLAKDGTGHYYASGYVVTAPIDLGPDVFKIDRIRWQQTVGEAVSIKVQTRTGNTPTPDASWSAWSAEQTVAVPEESARTGVPCTSPTARYIQVKLNLYTTDTQTPSETGTTFGFTPILHACEVAARYQTELSVGNVPASISRQLQGVEFSYANYLEAMGQICDKIKYEWEVDGDDRLNVAPQLGADKSAQIVLREGENTNITVLRDEPGEVVNVLTALGAGDGLAQLRITLQDDESIAKYGRRPGTYENRDLDDRDALLAEAQEYLAKMAWPQPELQVETFVDPEWPEFRVGDAVRVISPMRGINITARILEERRQSTERGEIVTLGLNTTLKSLIDVIVGERPGLPGGEVVAPPIGLAISSGIKLLHLQWYGYADYFVIEHSTDGVAFAVLEPHWTGWSYTHSNLPVGSEHWYKVYAVRGGKRSAAAGPVRGVASALPPEDMDTTAPATPAGLAVISSSEYTTGDLWIVKNTLTWDPNTEPDMKEYQVYRSDGNNTNYKCIAIVAFGTNSYVDTQGIKENIAYYYRIRAVDKQGNASPFSVEVSVTSDRDTTPPAVPTGVQVVAAIQKLVIKWNPNTEPDLKGYEVHVSTTQGFTPSANTLVFKGLGTIIDYTGSMGTTYYVRIRAYDRSENYSPYTAEYSAKTAYVTPNDYLELDGAKIRDASIDHAAIASVDAATIIVGKIQTDQIVVNGLTGIAVAVADESSVVHTTSTSYVDMPDMSVTLNVAENAKVLVLFQANVWNTENGRSVDTQILMDSVQVPAGLQSRHCSAYADATGNNVGIAVATPTKGSHTFKVQWRVTAGTGGAASRRLIVYQFLR